MGWGRVDGLRPLELGTPGRLRQELTDLVLAGEKRATAGLLSADYEDEGEAVEHVGELLALVDDHGDRVGTVRVERVEVVRFDDVTDDFARAEGEGFTGHDSWASAHRAFWAGTGRVVGADTPVVCLEFTLLDA